jgi:hypothetical protein
MARVSLPSAWSFATHFPPYLHLYSIVRPLQPAKISSSTAYAEASFPPLPCPISNALFIFRYKCRLLKLPLCIFYMNISIWNPPWYNWASKLSRPTKGYWITSCPPKNLCYGISPYSLGQVSLVSDTIVFSYNLFSGHQSTCTLICVSYDRIIGLDPNAQTKFFHFHFRIRFFCFVARI